MRESTTESGVDSWAICRLKFFTDEGGVPAQIFFLNPFRLHRAQNFRDLVPVQLQRAFVRPAFVGSRPFVFRTELQMQFEPSVFFFGSDEGEFCRSLRKIFAGGLRPAP